jgi:hypothetical protein
MCRVDSQIFKWPLHFLIQIIVLAACLQKTGGFARNWPLAHAKFAYDWPPVACKLYPSGRQSHANCTSVAPSRMQIIPAWPPVACNMNKIGMRLAATGIQFACDCRPLGYKTRDKQTRDKKCVKGCLYIIIIFLCQHMAEKRLFWDPQVRSRVSDPILAIPSSTSIPN